mmetsp:Transcript_23603/g.42656  ORF Transcript_23603/g.42656 Transcript_23603/m.42656 type:complete len:362 (+) Transcript_23603:84-1169(+)
MLFAKAFGWSQTCQGGEMASDAFNSCVSVEASVLSRNCHAARTVIKEALAELAEQCLEEEEQYARSGTEPPQKKRNRWNAYTQRDRAEAFVRETTHFVKNHPECRLRLMPLPQLRFLVMLQHLISEDVADFYRAEEERKHTDTFEGILTDAVNSQLVKDAHRSEWTIDEQSFTMQGDLSERSFQAGDNRKRMISTFQKELVTSLETMLLDFCQRRHLLPDGQQRLIQAVTTQMSQCGLANLDRASQAAKYFVSGQGLEQRTTYNISLMDAGLPHESLKLSLLCMKTGFSQYHTEESLDLLNSEGREGGPETCDPSSYLYQYATVLFQVGQTSVDGGQITRCVVIDALDEVNLEPVMLDEGI